MVYYLKYRPQTISDLDNERVRESLYSVLSNPDSVPHAFLFTGPKGLGKTSSARILAKAVNCIGRITSPTIEPTDSGPHFAKATSGRQARMTNVEPCNACDQCISITNGSNVDIQEIDAASNRGIDEMRELKEKIRLSPVMAKKKVYIIDEVHMLTTEAFNALLKTLEEPPSHGMFILCTTEPHKVPNTILSRCFHVSFSKATTEELVRSFKRIVEGNNLDIQDDVLSAVAKMCDGGFRDGAKMLEELVSLSGDAPITMQTLEKVYKTTSIDEAIVVLSDNLRNYDAKRCLMLISRLTDEGVDMKYFLEQFLEDLHQSLLMKVGVVASSESESRVSVFETDEIKTLLALFMQAGLDMRFSVMTQLPLELAVLEWCALHEGAHGSKAPEEPKVEEQVVEEVTVTKTTTVQPAGTTVASMRKQVGNIMKVKALYGEGTKEPKGPEEPKGISLDAYNNDGPLSTEWIHEFWRCLIEQMKTHNHTIAGVLRGCTINSFDKETLIIETAYKFHQEKLVDNKIKLLLESTCKELVGKPVAVSILLKQ